MGTSTCATLLVGFALGLKHAADADHVVAVKALVSGAPGQEVSARRTALVGAFWARGHLLTLFAADAARISSPSWPF